MRVVCLLWRWWSWRNKLNAGEKAGPVDSLTADINHWAIDSLALCRPPRTEPRQQMQQEWKKPEGDRLKINCDGAYSADRGTGSWGFAIRDQGGDVRGSGAGYLRHVASVMRAEAEGCDMALRTASSWGMTNIEVELNCQVLVKALQGTGSDLASEGILFQEIREFAHMNFSHVSFNFVTRACNRLAHELAAYGAHHQVDQVFWSKDLPDDVNVRMASILAGPV